MPRHQHLISKYNWKTRENFIKLSVDSAVLLLSIGPKMKTQNWRKVFYNVFYRKLDFPSFKQSFLSTYASFVAWLGFVFI